MNGRSIDFKLIAKKGLVYIGLTAILGSLYLVLFYLLHEWFNFDVNFPTVVLAVGVALGTAILSQTIRDLLNRKVEELIYPRTHDYRRMLLEFTARASHVIKIDELRDEITRQVVAALGVKDAYLLTPDTGGSDYTSAFASSNGAQETIPALRIKQDSPIIQWLLREGKLLFRQDLNIMPEYSNLWAEEITAIDHAEIEVFAPVISRGKLVAVLALAKKQPRGPYDVSDIDLIGSLTHGIAVAIENAEVHARIEKLAITDVMTGVFNRRYFDERLGEEVSRHARYGGDFSLVLFDLDHFKKYNDTYGHRVGDELLRQVAQAARESVRNIDLVFRYGGDEFALLLPETNPHEARVVCERVQTRLATRMQVQGTGVTLSMGIGGWPEDGKTAGELVRAADDALYYSKRSGGARVCLFTETSLAQKRDGTESDGERAALDAAQALVAAVDAKDHYTAPHSRLVAVYAAALARAAALSSEHVTVVEIAGLLHDVGKIGIPDELLGKTDKLTAEEWDVLKQHSQMAVNIIGPVPSLAPCLPIILHNHEWYDGQGYPDGLKSNAIPLEARILAIADAFASMISARPYCRAMSSGEAIEELRRCSGSQFDPELVEIFIPVAQTLGAKKLT